MKLCLAPRVAVAKRAVILRAAFEQQCAPAAFEQCLLLSGRLQQALAPTNAAAKWVAAAGEDYVNCDGAWDVAGQLQVSSSLIGLCCLLSDILQKPLAVVAASVWIHAGTAAR